MYTLYIYDRSSVLELLRVTTPQQLQQRLGADLTGAAQRAALEEALAAWERRALGELPLRDALCVDPQRGALFYGQLCAALAVGCLTFDTTEVAQRLAIGEDEAAAQIELLLDRQQEAALVVADWPALLAHGGTSGSPLAALAQRAQREGLALVAERADRPVQLALPPELAGLLPPPPRPSAGAAFEIPSGSRRALATTLVAVGILWLCGQIIFWDSGPMRPAGVPLALFTLALLVGVRAGWPGYLGSVCIWLVANLPGFHYRTVFSWSALSLLGIGLVLIAADRHIRAMWAWAGRRFAYHSRSAMPKK